jgi:hypothetical protein
LIDIIFDEYSSVCQHLPFINLTRRCRQTHWMKWIVLRWVSVLYVACSNSEIFLERCLVEPLFWLLPTTLLIFSHILQIVLMESLCLALLKRKIIILFFSQYHIKNTQQQIDREASNQWHFLASTLNIFSQRNAFVWPNDR